MSYPPFRFRPRPLDQTVTIGEIISTLLGAILGVCLLAWISHSNDLGPFIFALLVTIVALFVYAHTRAAMAAAIPNARSTAS